MGDEASEVKMQVLTVGLHENSQQELRTLLRNVQEISLPYDLEQLMEMGDKTPSLVLCGVPPTEIPVTEVAQTLRMNFPSVPMFLVAEPGERLDRKTIIKNGFTDIFFLPMDREHMIHTVSACLTKASKDGVVYKSVKLVDLQPETVLDFDTYIYLPANNKHIKYSNGGQAIEGNKIEKLKSHKTASVFVSQDDLPKFYEHTAATLRRLGNDTGISQTERNERMKAAVRDIVTSLFSDVANTTEDGKRIVSECQAIVKSYLSSSVPGGLYDKVLALSSDSDDIYSHISNTSTFAVLFGLALGLKSAEELGLAGLLHDIGLSSVPLHIQRKPESQRSTEEQELYQKHPDESVAIIKDRKLVLPDLVYKIIQQHHERYDGTGYPKKPPGARLCPEAQVMAFADRFDELLTLVPGQPRLTPAEAVAKLREEAYKNPGRQWIEPGLLKQLFSIFPEEADTKKKVG